MNHRVDSERLQPANSLNVLTARSWNDYALLDSGDGRRLERFGSFRFVRPEPQALWECGLPKEEWNKADGSFVGKGEDADGHWTLNPKIPARWPMTHGKLRFWAEPSPFRHMRFFPEQAPQWEWMADKILQTKSPVSVLNLFGYTGLATLACAAAGARVTHVDASKKVVTWARENLELSGLSECPVRWIHEDVGRFVAREVRRHNRYDAIILDPPKYGRGPNGEIWKLDEHLAPLLRDLRQLLSDTPVFCVMTAYAVRLSALNLAHLLSEMFHDHMGTIEAGEVALWEQSRSRPISVAIYARYHHVSADRSGGIRSPQS